MAALQCKSSGPDTRRVASNRPSCSTAQRHCPITFLSRSSHVALRSTSTANSAAQQIRWSVIQFRRMQAEGGTRTRATRAAGQHIESHDARRLSEHLSPYLVFWLASLHGFNNQKDRSMTILCSLTLAFTPIVAQVNGKKSILPACW